MKTMNKLSILLFLSVIGLSSCSKDNDTQQVESEITYNNSMSFGQDTYGIQFVSAVQKGTNLNLYLSSLTLAQLENLPEGSGASMEFNNIPPKENRFYIEIPTYHYYLAEVNNAKLLRSNTIESKKAKDGYIEVLEYTADNIKLKYSYTRKDGVVFKGEYNGVYKTINQ
ncbi:hypothetical protein [Tenacibaculum piscium]|uniref:hypothetical protein n=1 Tax=Tenacibaculum piscium TaxID=1458515 RepID=UPI001EFB141C|nr:hypothetical protein [Tenacibaculum piscium]MCG8184072.1 hypothetical protein [Tenacibaculum piscium]MCG8205465.1 hypothetical protein [Tenacibaculum piscium]